MKMKIYTLKDNVIGTHSLPFFAFNDAHALRICSEVIAAGDTDPSKNPSDCDFYLVGSFDELNALIIPEANIQLLCNLSSLPIKNSIPEEEHK